MCSAAVAEPLYCIANWILMPFQLVLMVIFINSSNTVENI